MWPALTGAEKLEFLARLHGEIDPAYRDESRRPLRVLEGRLAACISSAGLVPNDRRVVMPVLAALPALIAAGLFERRDLAGARRSSSQQHSRAEAAVTTLAAG